MEQEEHLPVVLEGWSRIAEQLWQRGTVARAFTPAASQKMFGWVTFKGGQMLEEQRRRKVMRKGQNLTQSIALG